MPSPNVTTRSYSNYRDGAQTAETVLTPESLQKTGIQALFDLQLADDARGTEAQVLAVEALIMGDGLAHDVFFVVTMADDVYAFDADNGTLLWKQQVGNAVVGSRSMDMYLINSHWGILSTPVIDPTTGTLYLVVMTSPNGSFAKSGFYLHAMSLVDGSQQATPLALGNATYQPPNELPLQKLGSVTRKQRPALTLDTRDGVSTVYVAFGSFLESASSNRGWVVACDVTGLRLSIAAAWTSTSRYSGAGIWMGSQGLSVDDAGYVHGMTGNGSFDGITDFGDCFFKLAYTPKTATAPASLTCVDWYAPYNITGVTGENPTLPDTSVDPDPMPVNGRNADDMDLGSGGPLIIPKSLTGFSKNVVMGAGKYGFAHVLDCDNLGQTALADFAPGRIEVNYRKALSPVYGFTYYPAGVDLEPTDQSTLPTTWQGKTRHQHSTPTVYKSPDHGVMMFTQGENSPLRAFRLNPDFTLTYLACSQEVASTECVNPPGGMPGGMLSLSCNGDTPNTAILWALMPYGDANTGITPGRLCAYGANWINETTGNLIKIWDSQDWGITWSHCKFNIATVFKGKVAVPTYDGRVRVLGPASLMPVTALVANVEPMPDQMPANAMPGMQM